MRNKDDGSDNEEEQEETIKLPTDAGSDKKPIIQVLNKDDTQIYSYSSEEDIDHEKIKKKKTFRQFMYIQHYTLVSIFSPLLLFCSSFQEAIFSFNSVAITK